MALLANLTGVELKVTGNVEELTTDAIILPDGAAVVRGGVAISVLLDLQKMMNFSIIINIVDGYFPETFEEGSPITSTTIAYQLATGNADLAVGLLYHVLYRLQFASPLMAFSSLRFYAFFKQPTNIMMKNNVFQKPFQPALVGRALLTLSAIGILAEFSTLVPICRISGSQLFWTFINGLGWVASTIAQQDPSTWNPNYVRSSIKFILYSGSLLSAGLYAYYNAAILSYFTMDQDIIQKFSQIAGNGFTVFAISSINSSIPAESGISLHHIDVEYNKSLNLVFEGNHAHLDTMDLFFLNQLKIGKSKEDACAISNVLVDGGIIRCGFYSRFDFPHKEVFGIGLLKILESGLAQKYTTNYLDSVIITCPKIRKQYHDDLGLDELWTLYSSYIWFMVVSGVLLALEIILVPYFCRAEKN